MLPVEFEDNRSLGGGNAVVRPALRARGRCHGPGSAMPRFGAPAPCNPRNRHRTMDVSSST